MYTPHTSLEKKALKLATKLHANQFRKSGEPYITHCIETAHILTQWGVLDPVVLSAALTHDLLEDTEITPSQLTEKLGSEVTVLVEGVTKFINSAGESDDFATKQKIAARSFLDPRVAILKLADRLHNMKTLSFLPHPKQELKSLETLNLYAPLAESLGMWVVKCELEDLAYSYLNPEEYKEVKQEINKDKRLKKAFLTSYTSKILEASKKRSIKITLQIRKNGLWTLRRKRDKAAFLHIGSRKSFSQIGDVVSIRLLCNTRAQCYSILALVHEIFETQVNQNRFDEYIVSPRNNGYAALQTTLETSAGSLEIAISTKNMERFNNWGVVSVLSAGNGKLAAYTRKVVFSLDERVWYVPKEATALDVAYTIHPSLGTSAKHVLINGERKLLNTVVPNAATVFFEVGDEKEKINKKALEQVALAQTRQLIAEQISMNEWEAFMEAGRVKVSKEITSQKRGIFELANIERKMLLDLLFRNGCKSLSELYYKVGIGNISQTTICHYLDQLGFISDNPLQRGILLKGDPKNDKPGILADVCQIVAKQLGNILFIHNKNDTHRGFETTLLVRGLTLQATKKIKLLLSADKRFLEVLFV